MFNLSNKEETAVDIKNQAADLVANVKDSAVEVGNDIKQAANNVGDKVQQKSVAAKYEANEVINSLKALLAEYTNSTTANRIKNQIVDKAVEIKGVVQDEVSHAYQAGKERTVQTVQEKPILSIAVALGAGVLLGYILGTKKSSK